MTGKDEEFQCKSSQLSAFFLNDTSTTEIYTRSLHDALPLFIAMVTVPLMANTVMGKSPFTGALWLLRLTGVIPLGAVCGGLLVLRVGPSPLTAAGLALVALGMFLASGWELGVADPELTVHLLIAGFGFGLVIAPITVHALDSAADDYRGTAASLVVVSRMMGMTLGLAALSDRKSVV